MIYERVKNMCDKKGITIYRLEKDLGFPASSVVKWKVSIPKADRLKKVAEYFGVTIDDLLEDGEDS